MVSPAGSERQPCQPTDLVLFLHGMGYETGIDLEKLCEADGFARGFTKGDYQGHLLRVHRAAVHTNQGDNPQLEATHGSSTTGIRVPGRTNVMAGPFCSFNCAYGC